MSRTRVAAHVAAILLACLRPDLVGQSAQTAGAVDREYVDHFRFHESKPVFVNEVTPADITTCRRWIR